MPALTVSMPAFNAAKYIAQAIASVLQQDDVDLELIVVDDGSWDNTVAVVRTFDDPRIRLITNRSNRGTDYCHNRVIELSRAPFIAHVDSDDLVLPGALRKMIDALEGSPRAGQAHCYFFEIDDEGRTTRAAFRNWREHILRASPPGMDYRWELLVEGTVINHLRTYRKAIFDQIGGFNENLKSGGDYEMALRIVERYDIKLVPQFLYAYRRHPGNTSYPARFEELVWWRQRFRISRNLLKSNQISFPKQEEYNLNRLMLCGLCRVLRIPLILSGVKRSLRSIPRRVRRSITSQVLVPVCKRVYEWSVDHFSWWPLDVLWFAPCKSTSRASRIGYYLWHFPVLSETFVQREVRALKESGVAIEIFADGFEDLELLDKPSRSLVHDTHYLFPLDRERLRRYKNRFFRQNPLQYLNALVYVVLHRYGGYKTLAEDRLVFDTAVYLAGFLQDQQITHIHSPWADRCAFIALIASRLSGVPYSVQARAHEIHRTTSRYALREKFGNAAFVITNSEYNQTHLKSLMSRHSDKIHVIRDMVDLREFPPRPSRGEVTRLIRILSVARLIEQKGLVYLLRACRILQDRGYSFQCEIVGGAEEPEYTNYLVELGRLHRMLRLEETVHFLGALPFSKVLEKYALADIFVLPCVIAQNGGRDITPNVLIEAMAMELPVIATTISGIPEIVEHNVSGILVAPNDADALAQALIELIRDPERRRELGKEARKRVEDRFEVSKNVLQYINLFTGTAR